MALVKLVPIPLSMVALLLLLWDPAGAQASLPIGGEVTATQELQLHETTPRRIWPLSFVVWGARPIPDKVFRGDSLTIKEEKKIHDLWRTPSRWVLVEIKRDDGKKTQGWVAVEDDNWFQTGDGSGPGQTPDNSPGDRASTPLPSAAPQN